MFPFHHDYYICTHRSKYTLGNCSSSLSYTYPLAGNLHDTTRSSTRTVWYHESRGTVVSELVDSLLLSNPDGLGNEQ